MQDSKIVITPEAVLSFPRLDQPNPPDAEYDPGMFTVTLVIAKDAPGFDRLKAAAAAAAKEKWGDQIPKGIRSPFLDGDDGRGESCEGCWLIRAKSKMRPGVVDANRQPVIDSSLIYSGVIARAALRPYAYDAKGNRGVAFGLVHVQLLRDGTRIAGSTPSAEDIFADAPPVKKAPPVAKPTAADPFDAGDSDVPF